jgi:thioredoxin 1
MSQIIEISSVDQFNTVIKSAKSVLVDYSTEWCGPCKRLAADLHQWIDKEHKYKNVTIVKIMADDEKLSEIINDITSIPTLHFYRNGKRVDFTYKENNKEFSISEVHGYDKNKVLAILEWLDS